MSFKVNISSDIKSLIAIRRYSTQQFDATTISAPSGANAAAVKIKNNSAIQNAVAINGLTTANLKDAYNVLETASSALTQIASDLSDIQTLTEFGSLSVVTTAMRDDHGTTIVDALKDIVNTVSNTKYKGKSLLNGNYGEQQFQIGPNSSDTVTIKINSSTTADLGLDAISIDTIDHAISSTTSIKAALSAVNANLSQIATAQRQLSTYMRDHEVTGIALSELDTKQQNFNINSNSTATHRQIQTNSQSAINFLFGRSNLSGATLSIRI